MANTAIQYTTSTKLKQWITDFDNTYIPSLIQGIVLCKFDGSLPSQTEDDLIVIFTGVRVYSRVMQGVDIDSETNIDFYTRNNTVHGLRGRHFIDLIGGDFQLKNEPNGMQLVIGTIIKNVPVFGQIFSLLDSLFAPLKKERFQEMQRRLTTLIEKFQEFLADWKDEDKKQHPEKYAVTDPEGKPRTPSTFKAVANPDGTITVSNIVQGDLVSIDGAKGLLSKDVTFTSVPLADGEHKITVKGQGGFSYADTVTVTTKVTFLSSPVQFAKNNVYLVLIVLAFALLFWFMYKRSKAYEQQAYKDYPELKKYVTYAVIFSLIYGIVSSNFIKK